MQQQKTSKIAFFWSGSLKAMKLVVFMEETVPVSLPWPQGVFTLRRIAQKCM